MTDLCHLVLLAAMQIVHCLNEVLMFVPSVTASTVQVITEYVVITRSMGRLIVDADCQCSRWSFS